MITLIFGDSIAWGAFDHQAGGWASHLKKRGFKQDDFVYNLSVSGHTSTDVISRLRNEVADRFDEEDDMRIIFAFGINDAARIVNKVRVVQPDVYEKNIKDIIKAAFEYTDEIYFVGPTRVNEQLTLPVAWNSDLYYRNSDITEYNDKLSAAVKQHKTATFIEMIDVLQDDELYDGVHPDALGHLKMWQKIISFIK